MNRLVIAVIASLGVLMMPARTQTPPPPDDAAPTEQETPRAVLEAAAEHIFMGIEETGGWEPHGEYVANAMTRLYINNDWTTEPDLFTLDVIGEVSVIPPWRVRERFLVLTERFADRYVLDDEQTQQFQGMVERETVAMFRQHALTMLPVMYEAAQMRIAGEPFTVEQVQRWSTSLEPVLTDIRKRIDATALEFVQTLNPDQQEIYLYDLAAMNRRLDRVEKLSIRARRGQWTPADWGLDEDPIQLGLLSNSGPDAHPGPTTRPFPTTGPATELAQRLASPQLVGLASPTSQPADEDAWTRYVREFIRRYNLTSDQQRQAWRAHKAAVGRRTYLRERVDRRIRQYNARNISDTGKIRLRIMELEEHWEATENMLFQTLKRRLDRIPTSAQRTAAAPVRALKPPPTTSKPAPTTQPATSASRPAGSGEKTSR